MIIPERRIDPEGNPRSEQKETCSTITILQELIKIPSFVDTEHDDTQLAEHISDIFERDGRYQIMTQPVEGNRVNLIVHDGTPPKVVLFGHMDTVIPKHGGEDPLTSRIEDGKLYGLGAVDMKAGLAVMISAALKNKRQGLGLIFTADEEYDFKGAFEVASGTQLNPSVIINLEPTNCEILNGCRGITEFTAEVKGKSVHASRKALGINAIEKTVELFHQLQKELTTLDLEGVENSLNMASVNGGVLQGINPDGTPHIGRAANIVPNFAEVLFEIRIANPAVEEKYVRETLKRIGNELGVDVSEIKVKFVLGPLHTPKEKLSAFEQSVKACGLPVSYTDVNTAGFYEVQIVQDAWRSDAVIVFGPGPKDKAHCANEYVDLDSVAKTEEVIHHFLENNL